MVASADHGDAEDLGPFISKEQKARFVQAADDAFLQAASRTRKKPPFDNERWAKYQITEIPESDYDREEAIRKIRRERGKRVQGSLSAGIPGSAQVGKPCSLLGHSWVPESSALTEVCQICGVTRTVAIGTGPHSKWPIGSWDHGDDPLGTDELEDEDYKLICIWCGEKRKDEDDLAFHEDECHRKDEIPARQCFGGYPLFHTWPHPPSCGGREAGPSCLAGQPIHDPLDTGLAVIHRDRLDLLDQHAGFPQPGDEAHAELRRSLDR